jgi:nitrilase
MNPSNPSSNLSVAAIQMVSGPDVATNLEAAAALIDEAARQGARLVVLPEYFALFGERETDKIGAQEPDGEGPIQQFLASSAARHGIWLVGAAVPIGSANRARVANACLVYGPDGRRRARYDKIHLFGFTRAGERFDEADTTAAGRTPVVFDCDAGGPGERWRVGLTVCYDLRFPELYRALGPTDLMIVPSSFTARTGQAHWEVLLRARAIENQCWVLAPAQGGRHPNGRRTWGHSMLVDPWGEVVAERTEDGSGIVVRAIDRSRINEVREGLPALSHRVM